MYDGVPAGLVLWPDDSGKHNRLCVLISDIHCTDCTVGNQTASENDWQSFFEQMEYAVRNPGNKALTPRDQHIDELILILNGDIVDLIRTSKWAQSGIYPWHRDDPRFAQIVVEIMQDIVKIHAHERPENSAYPYSGFFYWMRECIAGLRKQGTEVTVIPIVGNHDKELQVVPQARKIFYEQCLGITAAQIKPAYREWVARQLGTSPDDEYPCLPFYFADTRLRLFATHGQWRDADNARATPGWRPDQGWTPHRWRQEKYRAFSDPCFGDTVAAAMLSHFIWDMGRKVNRFLPGAQRICNLLDEMDLYRPSVAAVVRLLRESRKLAKKNPSAKDLHTQVLRSFRASLVQWLSHRETWDSAWGSTRWGLCFLSVMSKFRSYWVDYLVMKLMAKVQEPEANIPLQTLLTLPAFQSSYRLLGFRLHVEGHTHVALEEDLQFTQPRKGRNNYTYVNLGAWRDSIVRKRNKGFRRRGIGRALFVFDLARLASRMPVDAYRFDVRDMTSWGDRMDSW